MWYKHTNAHVSSFAVGELQIAPASGARYMLEERLEFSHIKARVITLKQIQTLRDNRLIHTQEKHRNGLNLKQNPNVAGK